MTAPTLPPPRRTGAAARVPGAVFSVLALAVLLLVATALNPAQPPPPPVAEYAPAAVRAITDAPPEQVAENGTGKSAPGATNGAAPGAASPPPGASALPSVSLPPKFIDVNRVSRCIGNPPRQTEDPQSPPCVPYFDGDNGGATAVGVTRNEIRVAMANATSQDVDILTRYFNTRFQFYGRQLKIVRDVGCFGGNPSSAKNAADGVAALKVFGAVGFCDIGGVEYYYYDELARKKVVSVSNRVTVQTEADFARYHPYEWTYLPSFDKGSRHLAELGCTLKGKNATHAGAAYVLSPRKFGLISNKFSDAPSPDLSAANAALKVCGIEPVRAQVTFEREGGAAGQGATPQTAQEVATAIQKMREAGVTTLLLLTHALTTRQIYAALDGQGYEPEIGVSTEFYNDEDFLMSGLPKSQTQHTFGISTWNKFVHPQDEPWYAAIKEVEPGHTFTEGNNPPPFSYYGARFDYHAMLVMAAGIQMAGPNLTAETFAKGLQSAAWPNPPTEKWPGRVTVSPGTHSYMEDAAAIWFDNASRSEYSNGNGAFCYVQNGVRRRLGRWPADDGLFRAPCQRF